MKNALDSPHRRNESAIRGLLPLLQGLDCILERAVRSAQSAWGSDTAAERFRGLYIGYPEIERLLQRSAGTPTLQVGDSLLERISSSHLGSVLKDFSLSPFDLVVILIALAPEIDLRYERLYAYLQDDVARKHPTVDLVLNLLCNSAEDRLRRRAHFSADSPLLSHRLVRLVPDPNLTQPSLLACFIKLDEQIVRALLGLKGLDGRLAGFCRLCRGGGSLDDLPVDAAIKAALPRLFEVIANRGEALVLHFCGPSKTQMRRAAEIAAAGHDLRLLVADLSRSVEAGAAPEETIVLVLREARYQGAVPYLEGIEGLRECVVWQALAKPGGPVITASTTSDAPLVPEDLNVIAVDFPPLNAEQRRDCWESHLIERRVRIDGGTLEALANRFRLGPEQIGRAVAEGCRRARWRHAAESSTPDSRCGQEPTPDDFYAAARAQCGHELAALARKISPKYTWKDIILPQDTMPHLREICSRVVHGGRVLGDWGFDRKLSGGKAVNALFAGPSGTGKTMAAEIIAKELDLDLYKIDLASVVSKYIGETEKNLDRIFRAAESANAILFFDEADALFGKRSEVRDSHDRYANIEVSYLLQKMEEYQGISILASNLRQHMDDSFIRRLAFTVLFPFPDEEDRRRIWQGVWPQEIPLAADLDFAYLAKSFKLSGGNIKNVALAAAFHAANDGGVVTMDHLFHATKREFEKMGKGLSEAELYGSYRAERPESTSTASKRP